MYWLIFLPLPCRPDSTCGALCEFERTEANHALHANRWRGSPPVNPTRHERQRSVSLGRSLATAPNSTGQTIAHAHPLWLRLPRFQPFQAARSWRECEPRMTRLHASYASLQRSPLTRAIWSSCLHKTSELRTARATRLCFVHRRQRTGRTLEQLLVRWLVGFRVCSLLGSLGGVATSDASGGSIGPAHNPRHSLSYLLRISTCGAKNVASRGPCAHSTTSAMNTQLFMSARHHHHPALGFSALHRKRRPTRRCCRTGSGFGRAGWIAAS